MWEALFCREVDGGFGAFLGAMRLATELMECGSRNQGKTQAKRVCTLLCQGQRFVDPRQPLLSIAEEPQRQSSKAMAQHTGILAIEEGRGTVLLGIIER